MSALWFLIDPERLWVAVSKVSSYSSLSPLQVILVAVISIAFLAVVGYIFYGAAKERGLLRHNKH